MEFRLQWVRGQQGGRAGQSVPTFDVETRRFLRDGRGGGGYRPSAATYWKRLGIGVGVLLLAAIMHVGITYRDRHGNVQRIARLEDMPPESRARYQAFLAKRNT